MSDKSAFITRAITAYANILVKYPGRVLLTLLVVGAISAGLASTLTIESDQLSLISQDLPEVKEVKRVIDMVGGAGYLQLALRGNDEKALKKMADSVNETLLAAKDPKTGEPLVRFITYKIPIEFVQENMVLFIKTEDLVEGRRRISPYLKDQIRRSNPFYIDLGGSKPVPEPDLSDLVNKYSAIGKKSIRDDFYISDDKQMMMILIKPMWNSTQLQRTQELIAAMTGDTEAGTVLTKGLLFEAAKKADVQVVEDYELMGDSKKLAFGFTGSYKTNVDDSVAIIDSLDDITITSLVLIAIVIAVFFRRFWPTIIVLSGTVLGTVMTLGFAKLTLGQLNMVTSIIAAILLGFGIDYGIHFTYRARIEFGTGKPWDEAIKSAFINAGRPALIAAIVTAGSFFVLLVSEFRGFSNFGFLAGFGTMITAFALFSWSPAILALAGHRNPAWPERLTGRMTPPSAELESGAKKLPNPWLLLGGSLLMVAVVCAFAVPWTDFEIPKDREMTMFERLKGGVRFNYNTRALMPVDQPSVKLQDEINRRFRISSDPIAVYTKDLEGAKDIWDAMTDDPDHNYNVDSSKYPSVDQVVSIFTFTPPRLTAEANAKVLAEWREEFKDLDVKSLPPDKQDKAAFFLKVLEKKPFDAAGLPEVYASQFRHLATTRVENHGYLTFLYPKVDLWDGKNLLTFADETRVIKGKSGKEYPSAGLAILYAKLARIVLWDGKVTVLLAALWILVMHYLDFRSVKLALASVIPLGVGLLMMLGMLSITNSRLNFMNLVILPILLGFGVSHGLYLLHRFLEGTAPLVALRSVGGAVASSTLTAIAGFASLGFAHHLGLRSIGFVACLGLGTTLLVSFTVLASVLQIIYDRQGAQKLGETKG